MSIDKSKVISDENQILTRDKLGGFSALQHAVWIFDIEHHSMWWANNEAIRLWDSESLEALLDRNWTDDMSDATASRLNEYLSNLNHGETITEQWTFYPKGKKALTVECKCSGILIEGGRVAMLVQGWEVSTDNSNVENLRGVEALRHTSVMISLYDEVGKNLFQNPSAYANFGTNDNFASRFQNPEDANRVWEQVLSKSFYTGEHQFLTLSGLAWHGIDCTVTTDPVTASKAILLNQRDISEQRMLQAQLSAAISAMPDGFIYFDKDDKFVVCNDQYRNAYNEIDDLIKPGNTFETILRGSVERGEIFGAVGQEDDWVQKRIARHRNPSGPFKQKLDDGRHLIITEYKTSEGGIVGIRRDVTDQVRAEKDLAESKELLQDAIESLGDAFALFDIDDRLVVANNQYKRFYKEIKDLIVPGVGFEELLRTGVERRMYDDATGREEEWIQDRLQEHQTSESAFEQKLADGRWLRVLERRTSKGGIAESSVDITELKAAQKEAEKANHAKSEFLSSMSHELRTPLNAIMGFGQLLEYNSTDPLTEKQLGHIGQILKGGSHLLDLIDQVLELSQIEAGKTSLLIENFSPQANIIECLAMVNVQAKDRNIDVVFTYPEFDMPSVKTDRNRFNQALLNLLTNAIKYNHESGSVTVSTRISDNGFLRISVTDTGYGVAPEKQGGLFEPFNRLGLEAGGIQGTGIGLTITKQIVELMGGEIGFESTENVGSTFWFELPISDDQSGVGTISPEEQVGDTAIERTASTGIVLYIEDNPANIQLMEAIINRLPNVSLKSAHTAELGLDVARDIKPDIILMDINLPGMDGIEALNKLRANEQTKNIPVVAISAAAMPNEIERGMAAGFEDYLTKPIQVLEVLSAIHQHIG